MFDWISDMVREANGIDSRAAKLERKEKNELKKSKKYIYSKSMKILTFSLGVIYILLAVFTVVTLIKNSSDMTNIIKYIILALIDFVVLFSLIIGKKKGEVVAVIGSGLFVIGLLIFTMI